MDYFRRPNRSSTTVDGVAIVSNSSNNITSVEASIKSKLVDSIKDIQADFGEGNPEKPIENNEQTHALVTAIEAIFIHGLKGQSSRAVKASSNRGQLPQPNFWTFVLYFSHRQMINRIDKLSAVTTDVGKGRAWIRLALNEEGLVSYLKTMCSDQETLTKHYQRHALMRDGDTMDVFVRYLTGIEIYRFNLALNSGLLNRWSTGPLSLAGLCTIERPQSEAVASMAIDAASLITENGQDSLAVASTPPVLGPVPASAAFEVIEQPAGYLNRGLLNEDEALKLILAGVSSSNFSGSSSNAESPMGTPKSPPSIKQPKNLVQKSFSSSPVVQSFQASADQNFTAEKNPEEKIEDFLQQQQEQHEENEHTIDVYNDNPPTQDLETIRSSTDFTEKETELVEKLDQNEEDDEEDEDDPYVDIYRRKSSSCEKDQNPDAMSVNEIEEAFNTCHNINDDDVEDAGFDNSESSGAALSGPQDAFITEISKRSSVVASGGLASSKSSSSAGSSVTLAVPYLAGFIDSWNPFFMGRNFDTPPKSDQTIKCGFSLKPHVQIGTLNEQDSQQMMIIFDQIICEEGLDVQNYECAECTRAIGTIFGPAKICSYTKLYYCEECHVDDTSTIPAKIMYNWDFRLFRVCKKAKLFLNAVNIEPIINVKSFNGELFNFAPDLKEVFELRKQLRYMNAYLATCANGKSPIQAAFRKMLWPRVYLYEEVDMYAIHDLEDIHNGKMLALLHSAVRFARSHILSCVLCSGKGFNCEVCRDAQVIYPFDLDAIMQCNKCYTVFHLDCSVKMENCPKCDRIEARNLNWHISLSKSQRGGADNNVMTNSTTTVS